MLTLEKRAAAAIFAKAIPAVKSIAGKAAKKAKSLPKKAVPSRATSAGLGLGAGYLAGKPSSSS